MSTHWTDGYVTELDYLYNYTAELNPARIALPFLLAGLAVPEVQHACELGFGQGLSLNIHAAGGTVQWQGTDFLPGQALAARHMAQASGAPLAVTDQAFAEFCAREDLPEFDFVALHGVWSWVSDANRAVIADFLRRKLKLGGVVYMGYNILPGWSDTLALRELMQRHTQHLGSSSRGLAGRIEDALAFAERMLAAGGAFAAAHPRLADTVAKLKDQDPRYLAHEYLNANWRPMFFSDVAAALEPAKLSYACSAQHELEKVILSPEQIALLQEVADPVYRESMRDLMTHQRFRADYWVKGARRLAPMEQAQALRELRLVLTKPRAEVQQVLQTPRGELRLNAPVLGQVFDLLADHRPHRVGELEQRLAGSGVAMPQLLEAVTLLVAAGDLALAQSDAVIAAAKPQTDRLNLHFMTRALVSSQVKDLASPVTGGGVTLSRVEQLLLYATLDPARKTQDLAPLVWQVFKPQGVKMLRDGQPLDGEADNLAELQQAAQAFVQQRLPVLRALGVVPTASKSKAA